MAITPIKPGQQLNRHTSLSWGLIASTAPLPSAWETEGGATLWHTAFTRNLSLPPPPPCSLSAIPQRGLAGMQPSWPSARAWMTSLYLSALQLILSPDQQPPPHTEREDPPFLCLLSSTVSSKVLQAQASPPRRRAGSTLCSNLHKRITDHLL